MVFLYSIEKQYAKFVQFCLIMIINDHFNCIRTFLMLSQYFIVLHLKRVYHILCVGLTGLFQMTSIEIGIVLSFLRFSVLVQSEWDSDNMRAAVKKEIYSIMLDNSHGLHCSHHFLEALTG